VLAAMELYRVGVRRWKRFMCMQADMTAGFLFYIDGG